VFLFFDVQLGECFALLFENSVPDIQFAFFVLCPYWLIEHLSFPPSSRTPCILAAKQRMVSK